MRLIPLIRVESSNSYGSYSVICWTPPRSGECAVRRMEQSSSGKRAWPGFGSEPTCHRRRQLKVREILHNDHQDSRRIRPNPRTAFFVLIVVDFAMVDAQSGQPVGRHHPEREPKPHPQADRLFKRLFCARRPGQLP